MAIGILKKEMDIGKMVDELADKISEAGMFCQSGVDAYLKGNLDAFTASLTCIRDTEKQGDTLRRSIEETLYRKTLIPDSRADVLELLENMDSLLDQLKEVVSEIEIERPVISEEFQQDFRDLLKYTVCLLPELPGSYWYSNNLFYDTDYFVDGLCPFFAAQGC